MIVRICKEIYGPLSEQKANGDIAPQEIHPSINAAKRRMRSFVGQPRKSLACWRDLHPAADKRMDTLRELLGFEKPPAHSAGMVLLSKQAE